MGPVRQELEGRRYAIDRAALRHVREQLLGVEGVPLGDLGDPAEWLCLRTVARECVEDLL